MNNRLVTALRVAMHLGALIPLVVLVWQYFLANLTANPIGEIQLKTGDIAINLLFLSLACTPIYLLSGFEPVLSFSRPLGLYAFMYICLHLFNFFVLDYGFNFTFIREDALFAKRYILAGLIAFVILLPLAIFSIGRLRKRLGRAVSSLRWLTYLAAIFIVIHFIWQTKINYRLPIIYSGVLVLLLAFRIPFIRKKLVGRFEHTAE
jgi:sulfoxide reductase heme-binding subunit YedZ